MSNDTQNPPSTEGRAPDDKTFTLAIPPYAALTPLERARVDDDPSGEWPVHVRFESVKAALKALRSEDHESEVVSVVEAARLLNLDRNTLYEMLKRGEGPPARRCGTAYRLDRDALREWLRTGGAARTRRGR